MSVVDSLSDEELVRQVELNLQAQQEQMEELGATATPQNISADGRAILIKTTMKPGLTSGEQIDLVGGFTDKTRAYFQEVPGVEVYVAGNASMQKESSESTLADTKLLFVLVFLFILLILFLTFRRVTDVIFTLLVILLTIGWVMGLSGWIGFPFSYSNAAIMPLLLGIDIAYAIHVLSRYYEERGKGNDPSASAFRSVVTVGVAVFLTAATTAFGFASFGISNMPIVQQFGVLCVVGVMVSFVLAVTLLPAVLVLRDRREKAQVKWTDRQRRKEEKNRWSPVDSLLARVAVLTEHHRGIVATFSIIILACSIGLGFTLGTEADVFKMLPQDLPFLVANQRINDYFGGQETVYSLVRGDILEPANLEAMLAYEEALASVDHVGEDGEKLLQREKIYSIADVVKNYAGSIPQSRNEVLVVAGRIATGKRLGPVHVRQPAHHLRPRDRPGQHQGEPRLPGGHEGPERGHRGGDGGDHRRRSRHHFEQQRAASLDPRDARHHRAHPGQDHRRGPDPVCPHRHAGLPVLLLRPGRVRASSSSAWPWSWGRLPSWAGRWIS